MIIIPAPKDPIKYDAWIKKLVVANTGKPSSQKGKIRVPKEVRVCTVVGCGNKSKLMYPSSFSQPKEKYLCKSHAIKKVYEDPKERKRQSDSRIKYFENITPEEKIKLHEAQIIAQNTPEAKKRRTEQHQDPEYRKHQSITQINAWDVTGERERRSKIIKETTNKPEVKAKIGVSSKIEWDKPGVKEKRRELQRISQNRPEAKERKSQSLREAFKNPSIRAKRSIKSKELSDIPYIKERRLIGLTGQGFWYGHPSLCPENHKKIYCELWNKYLWVRIDAAWEYKSALSGVTRWETPSKRQLSRHHVYWQEKACCVWDEDAQGYYAMINNGTKAKPEMVKYYIKGDPNKFVLLTAKEHGGVRGSKKSGKDKIYWIKYFEDLIEKREAEGKSCYLSKEDYEVYKVEHADTIAYYTQKSNDVTLQSRVEQT